MQEKEEDVPGPQGDLSKGYDYLLSMKIWSLTWEKVAQLQAELDEKQAQVTTLRGKSPGDLWLEDLDALEVALDEFENAVAVQNEEAARARKKQNSGKSAARRAPAKKPKKRAADSDSEDDDDDVDSGSDYDEKPKAKAKPKAAAAKPAPVPAKKAKVAAASKVQASDPDVVLLSQHMEMKLAVSPPAKVNKAAAKKPATKATAAPAKPAAAKVAKKAPKAINLVEDDDDDVSGEDDIFDSLPQRTQRTAR